MNGNSLNLFPFHFEALHVYNRNTEEYFIKYLLMANEIQQNYREKTTITDIKHCQQHQNAREEEDKEKPYIIKANGLKQKTQSTTKRTSFSVCS